MSRNARLSVARGFLHDLHCMSEHCPTGDGDHARRTQHRHARAVADAAPEDLAGALHDAVCLNVDGCDRERHLRRLDAHVSTLQVLLAT